MQKGRFKYNVNILEALVIKIQRSTLWRAMEPKYKLKLFEESLTWSEYNEFFFLLYSFNLQIIFKKLITND